MARIRPETGFETTIASGAAAADNTLSLTTAPTETAGYMVIEPGTSNKEIIKYSGVSSTTLTGVTRGIALTGSSDAAGTGKTHAAGVTVSMTNVHYYMEQLGAKGEANTWTTDQTFESANINIGDGSTDEDEQITANNGDANPPFIRYDSGDSKWYISNNGTDTYDPQAGGSGVTAGDGIDINAGAITVDPTEAILGLRIAGLAGETINGATLPVAVYQNTTDNEFYACDGNDGNKSEFTGFAVTNGTDGNALTVQTNGIVSGFTGLTEGAYYFVQDDGTIGTSVGTVLILVGRALSETQLLIIRKDGLRAVVGDNLMMSGDTSRSNATTSYVKVKEAVVTIGGTYRVKFNLEPSINGYTVYGRIYKNGVAFGTEQSQTTGTGTKSEDLVFEAGDLIQVYAKGDGTRSAVVTNFRIYIATYKNGGVTID
jgi:hypothetical protein